MTAAAISLSPRNLVAPVDRRIFGSFVEHLGRCVYTGIYEPGHDTANEDGFRTDVIELARELGSTTIRYPGGNFVSGYRWEDGIGPKGQRPVRKDLAWHSTDTNEFGLDEFAKWCRLTGSDLMIAVNLGTRGVLEALDVLEYTNHQRGTALSDLRRNNGTEAPHDVRMWCLGNEMDGPWQVGHMSADDYGKLAARVASAMKMTDPSLELVVCGSSSSSMPTFGEWERIVLEHTYEHVEFVSCHAYYQLRDDDVGSFLAASLDMDYFIATVVSTADHVRHKLHSPKEIYLSFDEWNIWYIDEWQEKERQLTKDDPWPVAPRLLEDTYTVLDGVVLGSLMITLLKNHDRVRSASLAQLVNVIAPIMTEPGGIAWRQTTFFPFSVTSRLARGIVLRPRIDAETYATKKFGDAPIIDAVATYDADTGHAAVFVVNRLHEEVTVTIDLSELSMTTVTEAVGLFDDDIMATNTLERPERVALRRLDNVNLDRGVLTVVLPAVSWSTIALGSHPSG